MLKFRHAAFAAALVLTAALAPVPAAAQQKITIGVSLAQDDNPFYIAMLRGIRARAQELGWDVATVSANEDKVKQINGVQDLVARGVNQFRKRLFVIDGSKALRKAIDQVFGEGNSVQRCRNHKVRNVVGHLPQEQHDQARSTLKAAFKLEAEEGMAKIDQYASWLEREWPSAAASLREGLTELFTINRLGLPSALRRCLGTTNLIDNSHSAVRERTRRVKNWQNGTMALRWAAEGCAAPGGGMVWPLRRSAIFSNTPRFSSKLFSV